MISVLTSLRYQKIPSRRQDTLNSPRVCRASEAEVRSECSIGPFWLDEVIGCAQNQGPTFGHSHSFSRLTHRACGAPARTAPDRRRGRGPGLLPRRRTIWQALFLGSRWPEKKTPRDAGPGGSPTKEPSGAVGHPFVDFGFLVGRQTHEFLGCRIAHELLHLLGLFRFLEFGETGDPVVTGIAVEKFTH